ncbi:hypothetical protein GWI33_012225 [Rhynchophorus ferrugineus]|uniref:Uncharacterized protein n=1 Tax=Rhynchophorus ferrugineus TaxID=354439 RepID=A0A834MB10_RHYFE|nr:hypothetical protein GWI33_012225 [Rhynchophorus ferrugineus]
MSSLWSFIKKLFGFDGDDDASDNENDDNVKKNKYNRNNYRPNNRGGYNSNYKPYNRSYQGTRTRPKQWNPPKSPNEENTTDKPKPEFDHKEYS